MRLGLGLGFRFRVGLGLGLGLGLGHDTRVVEEEPLGEDADLEP